ncbi:hypothetical protein [Cyanobium sp. Morenito 9A2]|uniref:hypothetical protein n=1 Tax=Cyanobium sp. Morenito 9A2 TaxID=2823718 RepID=UPI0020CDEDEC|nr:hypothetical protein [Cyanobium sp. Morenito 9A2]
MDGRLASSALEVQGRGTEADSFQVIEALLNRFSQIKGFGPARLQGQTTLKSSFPGGIRANGGGHGFI